jgi:uncharacterized protein (DUF1684 family)
MKHLLIIILFLCCISTCLQAQPKNYIQNIKVYQKAYVQSHEVVLKKDKKYFRFFPANENYKVVAKFKKLTDTVGFIMKTSGTKDKKFFRYGTIHFTLNDRPLQLTLYQSQLLMTDTVYKNYLFLPFTDLTSGEESYGGGRYLDPLLDEIKDNSIIIDFNKAYNPYCAYTTGYNCPIPPRENDLPIPIKAGEKAFGKKNH